MTEIERALRLIAETPTTHEGKHIIECAQVFQNIAKNALASARPEAAPTGSDVNMPDGTTWRYRDGAWERT